MKNDTIFTREEKMQILTAAITGVCSNSHVNPEDRYVQIENLYCDMMRQMRLSNYSKVE